MVELKPSAKKYADKKPKYSGQKWIESDQTTDAEATDKRPLRQMTDTPEKTESKKLKTKDESKHNSCTSQLVETTCSSNNTRSTDAPQNQIEPGSKP